MDIAPNPRPHSLKRIAMRSLLGGFAAAAIAGLGFQSLAGAQGFAGFNANQPIDFAADRIELQDRQDRVVLSGDVVFTQGNLRLTAGRTTVSYSNEERLQIQRIDATGGVTVTRGGEQASGAAGIYDFNRRVIILSGGVTLKRDGDTLNGGRLVIDLRSGVASVDGRGSTPSGESAGGRVTGTFSVPEDE
ncbi:lipopolysaccharide export system protein LptA [Altererythrobacter atlanticus]|uniref:LPS-assembly protein LptD n=1 Tax=Croceibacterium atlanticum TaxID=1267766 RepID=A0A0F7KRQ0_9SPHN|nr:LptA/OstA family protein [Croceibacterium atlanticum]AKH43148.1 LPS-assembly protein LptD [Croceibacterium atlanticum]MBB5732148.1 lipopolysaccharide export system protein LptA [Croceibacterium atlanticum]